MKEVVMDQLFRIILTYNPYMPLICQSFIRSSEPLPLQNPPPSVLLSNSTYFLSMMQGLGFLIENGRDGTVFSIHPSLEDYLTSFRRCHGTDFYVDRLAPASSLTWTMVEICFDSMAKCLRQNICSLDDTMVLNEEISDRADRVRQYIPVILQHACRNWMFHLEALNDPKRDNIHLAFERLKTFLSNHLLHWIECISLLGWVDVIPTSLDRLSSWLDKHGILPSDDQQTLTQDAIQFIRAFAPIISKAAMQTYHSALPLMPSDSLLSQKYSDMSRLSLKLSGSKYSSIIHNPGVILSIDDSVCSTANSGDVMALSLAKGGIAFFDTRTGNEIGSKIPTADNCQLIAFSPNGRWIITWSENQRVLDVWNVQTRAHAKTIASEFKDRHFRRVNFSTDGTKVMIVTSPNEQLTPHQLVFIWDVKTDKPLKQLEVPRLADEVTVSPDGSHLAVADHLGIEIIEVDTGHPIGRHITPYNDSSWSGWTYCSTPRLIWSPSGQFLASASLKRAGYFEETTIYLLSLSAKVSSISRLLGVFTTKYILDLTCSPDSSKVVAILGDVYNRCEMTLSIWCTRSGSLVGNTTFNLTNAGDSEAASIAFAANGRDIIICNYDLYADTQSTILLRFSVLPTHLETYMDHPSKFHPSQAPHTIQYSHYISGPIDNYASHVDSDGWILNTNGEREIWTPWAGYEVLCSCKPLAPEGQTQYRTLEVKDPETKTVVLIYVIAFEQRDVDTRIQEETASVE